MKLFCFKSLLLSLFLSHMVFADDLIEPLRALPPDPLHAHWVFSGVVTTESGDHYGYFFQMRRDDQTFHTIAALFDGQNKKVLLMDESDAVIPHPETYNWHVGRAFLRFNPINDSWIFGLKTEAKKGFNFKVDLLDQLENVPPVQALRPGVSFLVNQTSRLNGHLQVGDDSNEQFVTAKHAWFRQVWLSQPQEKPHPFNAVLCRFNDDSGFYSMSMNEADTLRGAIAGWRDEQGLAMRMSQFIHVSQDPAGPWHIRIASPNQDLVLADAIQHPSVVAGFLQQEKQPGFCMLSKDVI